MKLALVVALLSTVPALADVSAPAKVSWRSDVKAAEREAGTLERPLLVFFSAEWCMPCKEMLAKSFADRAVADTIARRFVPLLVDMTHDDDAAHAVAERYKVRAMPTLLVVRGSDERLRRESFADAAELKAVLDRVR
jgi:protein disulfide-isomerase